MEETEDPGLLTFLQDIKSVVLGVWSIVHCFLTVSYLSGKYCVEWISWFGGSVWEGFCLTAEGLKALFHAIIELEESLIRAVVLIHYGIGQIFEAFETTFYDLVDFLQHFQMTQLKLLDSVFVGGWKALSTVIIAIPQHICSALVIIGDSALELLTQICYVVRHFCIQLVWSPINVILFVSDLGLQAAALPGKILATVPFSAHVGSIVLLLVYVLYCKLSFFRLLRLLLTCARILYQTITRIPHFLSQIRRLTPGFSRSVFDNPGFPINSKGICVICYDDSSTFLANPCNHLCLCSGCVHQVAENDPLCPVCRSPVYSKFIMYYELRSRKTVAKMRVLSHPLNSAVRTVRIWNSLAKPKAGKIELNPKKGNLITWYACGPTVYDSAHIGHASSYVRLDVIRRILERQNYKIIQILGITDIDDKIINRANQQEIPWEKLSRKYELEFVKELEKLNVKPAHIRARVSNYIPQIITFVQKLINLGFAYPVSDGSVYFDTSVYTQYGKFATTDDYELSSSETLKKNKKDFAVWKGWKPKEPFWVSPWGKGRPGWHIECSVMASHYFGPTLDIHSGGSDLMFPHHENEEAQCCAHFGVEHWVTHWIHTGHLVTKEVKMSKSLGNTLTISDFLKDNSANSLRMLCLVLNSVRSELFYTPSTLDIAKAILGKFENFIFDCNAILYGIKPVSFNGTEESLWAILEATETEINNVLCDDFNTSDAVDLLIKFVSEFHRRIHPQNNPNVSTSGTIDFKLVLASQSLVQEFLTTLGFTLNCSVQQDTRNSELVQPILEEFLKFRQSVREFSLAFEEEDKTKRKLLIQERQQLVNACDEVRERLGDFGVDVKDHGKTSSWALKNF
ncbi:unnamed protein product [Allacma fusca]|nr:unnamed protein product [Allacma fusca]